MIIVDAHQDIAYNALSFLRDYRQSALQHREREQGAWPAPTIGLPDALLGRVALVFSTLFVAKELTWPVPGAKPLYTTPKQAYQEALNQLDYYQRLADSDKRVQLVRNHRELDSVLATWADDQPMAQRQQGLVILMEGADPIIEPRQFEEWYERGVRIVGTAWKSTRYSGGTSEAGGLTRLGYELLEVMAAFNAMLDLSHMAEQAYLEALDTYTGPVIASHSNPRKFRNSDRHLSDHMMRRLSERDGVMGVVLYNAFLRNDYTSADPKSKTPVSLVVDVVDHICQVTGSAAHVGIGSDFDGGFGAESIPEGLNTVTDLLVIAKALGERGYTPDDVDAIMSGNMLRKLRQALPLT